jgi:hypothetical protein
MIAEPDHTSVLDGRPERLLIGLHSDARIPTSGFFTQRGSHPLPKSMVTSKVIMDDIAVCAMGLSIRVCLTAAMATGTAFHVRAESRISSVCDLLKPLVISSAVKAVHGEVQGNLLPWFISRSRGETGNVRWWATSRIRSARFDRDSFPNESGNHHGPGRIWEVRSNAPRSDHRYFVWPRCTKPVYTHVANTSCKWLGIGAIGPATRFLSS